MSLSKKDCFMERYYSKFLVARHIKPVCPGNLVKLILGYVIGRFSEQCQGLEQHFAFGGNVLSTIENTLPSSVKQGDSFTISCKNSSWVSRSKCNLCLDHIEQELNDSFRSGSQNCG